MYFEIHVRVQRTCVSLLRCIFDLALCTQLFLCVYFNEAHRTISSILNIISSSFQIFRPCCGHPNSYDLSCRHYSLWFSLASYYVKGAKFSKWHMDILEIQSTWYVYICLIGRLIWLTPCLDAIMQAAFTSILFLLAVSTRLSLCVNRAEIKL